MIVCVCVMTNKQQQKEPRINILIWYEMKLYKMYFVQSMYHVACGTFL